MLTSIGSGAVGVFVPETGWITEGLAQWLTIIGIVGFVIGAILILWGLTRHRGLIKVEDKNTHIDESVTSYNQQGGITARNVNIQPSDRKLTTNLKQQIKELLSKYDYKKIEVTAILGDAEAFRLASQIKDYLVSEGYEIHGVNQAIYTQPVQGLSFEEPDDKGVAKIIIGGR